MGMLVVDVVEGLNLLLTVALMVMGLQIFFSFGKANLDLLKARMFLKKGLIHNMWLCSGASGGFFVAHVVSRALDHFYPGLVPQLVDSLILTAFLVPFVMLTYFWADIIKGSVRKG